jgi:PIN domain nuclease of toxin-antitoxin system
VILLDTHTLIWLTEGHSQLGDSARHLADEALAHDDLWVSAVSFWETAMLHQRGRIRLVQPVEAWRRRLLDQGVREWPLTGEVGIAAATSSTSIRIPPIASSPPPRCCMGRC